MFVQSRTESFYQNDVSNRYTRSIVLRTHSRRSLDCVDCRDADGRCRWEYLSEEVRYVSRRQAVESTWRVSCACNAEATCHVAVHCTHRILNLSSSFHLRCLPVTASTGRIILSQSCWRPINDMNLLEID